ncbi:MAG: DUF6268 family outer membrane beta-barrel protein [Pirellulaceae bacterium]
MSFLTFPQRHGHSVRALCAMLLSICMARNSFAQTMVSFGISGDQPSERFVDRSNGYVTEWDESALRSDAATPFTPMTESRSWSVDDWSTTNRSTELGFVENSGEEAPVIRFKKKAIQSISFSGGALWSLNENDLSSQFAETSIGLAVPLGSFDRILGVTPSFRVDLIDADSQLDVPDKLYQTGIQFFYRSQINARWSWMAIVQPAVRSDFSTSDHALRIFGLGLLNWQLRPERLVLSFGAVYLDRADLPPLPALGLTWTPQARTKLDLRFPESKWSWRIQKDGSNSETWCFLAAGIGGNTWAVTRRTAQTDELSLRDIRIQWGLDHVVHGGGGWFAQVGYAFDRSIEYESDATEIALADALLLEAGWRY